jgi:hypothetical protein
LQAQSPEFKPQSHEKQNFPESMSSLLGLL